MYENVLSSLSVKKKKTWKQASGCMLSCFSRVQLCNPMVCGPCSLPHTPEAPLSTRFAQQEYWSGLQEYLSGLQEYWSGLPSPPGDLSNPGIKLTSPALQADSLLLSHSLGKPQNKLKVEQKYNAEIVLVY